jgi:hypothetical protein
VFAPPSGKPDLDYAALQALVTQARNELSSLTPEAVNALVGRDVTFKLGDRALPFTTEGFLMSFSLPNFFFHVTMTYALLRQGGGHAELFRIGRVNAARQRLDQAVERISRANLEAVEPLARVGMRKGNAAAQRRFVASRRGKTFRDEAGGADAAGSRTDNGNIDHAGKADATGRCQCAAAGNAALLAARTR